MDVEKILAATAGYERATRKPTSADRPNRIALIDPAYNPASWPDTQPRLLFAGEQTPTTKRWPVLGTYWPHPGDRVVVMPINQSGWVILGPVASEDGPAVHTPGPTTFGNIATGSVVLEAPGDFTSVTAGRAGERAIEYGPLAGSGSTRVFTTADSATSLLMTTQAHTITASGALVRLVDTLAASSTTSRIVQWLAVRGWG